MACRSRLGRRALQLIDWKVAARREVTGPAVPLPPPREARAAAIGGRARPGCSMSAPGPNARLPASAADQRSWRSGICRTLKPEANIRPVPTSQAQAIADLELLDGQYQVLLTVLVGAGWERPGTIGGGDWSLRDLVGHILSWEELALAAISAAEADRPPLLPDGDIDEINREMVERQGQLSLADLRLFAEACRTS